jgi:uncharacterized protein with PIN domain
MIQRQCPECSSELVRARRSDNQPVPGMGPIQTPGWRCSVCGQEFTTQQIREGNRARSAALTHA